LLRALLFFLAQKEKKRDHFRSEPPVPSDAVLKQRLKAEEYFVVRQGGTKRLSKRLLNNDRTGIFTSMSLRTNHSFTSLDKYDGQIGMPTFRQQTDLERSLVEKPRLGRYAAHRGARQAK